ncbi:Ras-related protein Rab-32B [Armadillidium vulgare]|nr:Ras-related protein Rab-32B [Armadillidium vulgare]
MKISSIQTSEELQFKVLVVGEYGVGTAVIRRYTEGQFSLNYKVTIGVDFAVKTFDWDSKTKLNIQLWDIAGHERFGTLTRPAVIVFDLSRPESLQSWVIDIREKTVLMDGKKIPVILLANKCDVEGITINTGVISKFCAQHDIDKWFLTSAKENININAAMEWIDM